MFNLKPTAQEMFRTMPVPTKPVLNEEVAAVKKSLHQHRGKQPIGKTTNEAQLQRTPWATAQTTAILTSLSDPNLWPFSTFFGQRDRHHAQVTV
jgi:hypothetical protein